MEILLIAIIIFSIIMIAIQSKNMKDLNDKNAHEKMYMHKIKNKSKKD